MFHIVLSPWGQNLKGPDLRADRQDLALGPGGSSGQQLGKVGQSETGGTTAGGGATMCLVRSCNQSTKSTDRTFNDKHHRCINKTLQNLMNDNSNQCIRKFFNKLDYIHVFHSFNLSILYYFILMRKIPLKNQQRKCSHPKDHDNILSFLFCIIL